MRLSCGFQAALLGWGVNGLELMAGMLRCCAVWLGFDPARGLNFMTCMQGLALGCFFHKEKTLLFLCCNSIFLCCDL